MNSSTPHPPTRPPTPPLENGNTDKVRGREEEAVDGDDGNRIMTMKMKMNSSEKNVSMKQTSKQKFVLMVVVVKCL